MAVEEPETALHPAATAVLLEALRDAADRRQVIVTSHSPELLDHEDVDPDELRAVRADQGRSVIGAPDEEGAFALRAQLRTAGDAVARRDRAAARPVAALPAEPSRGTRTERRGGARRQVTGRLARDSPSSQARPADRRPRPTRAGAGTAAGGRRPYPRPRAPCYSASRARLLLA